MNNVISNFFFFFAALTLFFMGFWIYVRFIGAGKNYLPPPAPPPLRLKSEILNQMKWNFAQT